MTPRPSFTRHQRAAIFRDCDGICHICSRKIAPGEQWQVEHVKARGLGGSDKSENLRPAHIDCHAGKTRKEREIMADADSALLKHCGLDKETKRSRWPKRRLIA